MFVDLLIGYIGPPNCIHIECGTTNHTWRRRSISFKHTSLRCLLFDPHQTTHRWNTWVSSRKTSHLRPVYITLVCNRSYSPEPRACYGMTWHDMPWDHGHKHVKCHWQPLAPPQMYIWCTFDKFVTGTWQDCDKCRKKISNTRASFFIYSYFCFLKIPQGVPLPLPPFPIYTVVG